MSKKVRLIRILEYYGTREFVESSLQARAVVGEHNTPNGYIREGFIGEPFSDFTVDEEDEII